MEPSYYSANDRATSPKPSKTVYPCRRTTTYLVPTVCSIISHTVTKEADRKDTPFRQSQFATQPAAELARRLTQSLRDSGDMSILEPGTFERYV